MAYEFTVLSQGESAWNWDGLEGMAERLEEFLNSPDSRALQEDGWQVWQSHIVTSPQRVGFMIVLCRLSQK